MVFETTLWLSLLLTVCALCGIVSGVFGIGGGFFVVPVLNFMFMYFYDSIPNTMAVATTTSLCNICIVNGISSYRRMPTLSKLRPDLPWIMVSSLVAGVIGSFVAKMASDDFLHILFPCFLLFVIILRILSRVMASNSLFQGMVFQRCYYPMLLIPVGIICVLCGIGGGLVMFPLMLSIYGDKHTAVSVSSFYSLLLSFCSLIVTIFFPDTYTQYPVIYANIYLPMIFFSVLVSPFFTLVGAWANSNLSINFLDVLLFFLIILIVFFQWMTF